MAFCLGGGCRRTMIELLTTAEMGEAERLAIAGGVVSFDLMENAGRAVADAVMARHQPAVPVAVVAGPGNNGGDGFVAARFLAERGYRVRALLVGEPTRLKDDAALAAQRWQGPTVAAAPAALLPGRLHCGNVRIADIGIAASVLDQIKPRIAINAPNLWAKSFPLPRVDGHKYARGHAVVVSGGVSSTGAARLAARGALRAGAGLVTIASPREALAVNAAASLAVMVRPVDGATEL